MNTNHTVATKVGAKMNTARHWMNAILAVSLGIAGSVASAADRAQAVQKTEHLRTEAIELAEMVQAKCGCPNTAATLYDIAELTVPVDLAARFDTVAVATQELKDVVRKVIKLQQFVAHIPSRDVRIEVKLKIGIAINDLGRELMGNNWVIVKAAPSEHISEEEAEEFKTDLSLMGLEGSLENNAESEF